MGVEYEACCRNCLVWAQFDKSRAVPLTHSVARFDWLAAQEPPGVNPSWFADAAWRAFLVEHEGHFISSWCDGGPEDAGLGAAGLQAAVVDGRVGVIDSADRLVYDLDGFTEVTEPLWRAHGYTGADPTLK